MLKSPAPTRLSQVKAVIQEALRLHPALNTRSARETTQSGVYVVDTFILPSTTIIAPRFPISHRQDCFERVTGLCRSGG